ncbi:protein kinase, ATP binding site-containing protein [Tanacetum coccineum]
MYVSCGSLDNARKVFDEMSKRDFNSWAIMIAGYADNGEYEEVIRLFVNDKFRYIMYSCGGFLVSWIMVCVLKACGETINVELGEQVHGWLMKSGYSYDLFVGSSLISFYGKVGCFEDGDMVFDQIGSGEMLWCGRLGLLIIFQHIKIELEAIKYMFDDAHCIGKGGFGKVYKGELIHSNGQSVVALKRLDRAFGQGNPEFWKEVIMLSLYKHDNIVYLLGFCDDCGEMILVYEYASKRSLDLYLNDKDLICIGAARGLAYLHNPGRTQQRVLHRDIKSSNILLDENWNARIVDLGLSKFGPANQKYTFLVSNAVGTNGYCDPLYAMQEFHKITTVATRQNPTWVYQKNVGHHGELPPLWQLWLADKESTASGRPEQDTLDGSTKWAVAAVAAIRPARDMTTPLCLEIRSSRCYPYNS